MKLPGLMLATAMLALCADAATARAETFKVRTTGDLLAVCAPGKAGAASAGAVQFCDGFIVGTGQLYKALRQAGAIDKEWACAEPAPAVTRIREAFVSWARAHPERHGETAVDGFWRAAAATWPC
ncbi:Rap1a/Tai family immunity protein [Geminicoccaceae bacterium 1502E]|nr:Rap1a/Tai family immunity protein [Geminicoccaceae bacterium 1502E]